MTTPRWSRSGAAAPFQVNVEISSLVTDDALTQRRLATGLIRQVREILNKLAI
jgi:hypothetical protein